MIYIYPDANDKVKQGDIFLGIPKVICPPSFSVVGENNGTEVLPWEDVVREGKEITAIVGITSAIGIVASQNCDVERAPNIMLCEILNVGEIHRSITAKNTQQNIIKEIFSQLAKSSSWFYLPRDDKAGFSDRMGVDFMSTFSIPREQLNQWRRYRKARLNHEAYEHFRERLSFFFHRYAFREWYPLNKEEIEYYPNYNVLTADDFLPWQK
jgi:hypothetical protein